MFLTCLELLDVCAKSSNNITGDAASLLDTYSTHVAALYDCARSKVCRNCDTLTILTCISNSNESSAVFEFTPC